MLSYEHLGGASARVAVDRRVQYTAPHCGVRVLYRFGAQSADPDRRGDTGIVENSRPSTERDCRARRRPLLRGRGRGMMPTGIEECGAPPTGRPWRLMQLSQV